MSPLTADRARQGTYSIVARDPGTGELGVAVQSHWFSVGPIVPWARAGVGAVATQANAELSYGPRGLDLLAAGHSAPEALARLLAEDPLADSRQVAFVDAAGRVATHTGTRCMAQAGDCQGDGVSCQANIMVNDRVWPAMLAAYEQAPGALTTRLLAALDAAEAQGGDLRGRQSAAIIVVPAAGEPWDTVVSLRVEDHPDPLGDLRRLMRLHDAYAQAGLGDERMAAGDHVQAAALYLKACELAPESDELHFWAAVGSATVGDLPVALSHLRRALAIQPSWRELLTRLVAEDLPAAGGLLQALDGER
ncbi:MAG TPA: DUF1028 domain-containing protein [Solirubrobacteraceae bacterium]|nr:DUF1028 domain-containing protein [Solirubrobacteraceae bacterium]